MTRLLTDSFRFCQLKILPSISPTDVQSVVPECPGPGARAGLALSEILRQVAGSDHHPGLRQGVVAQPELPDDPPVVAIVLGLIHVLPIEIRLEAAIEKLDLAELLAVKEESIVFISEKFWTELSFSRGILEMICL